ncbi:MAG: DNA helicase RecQ [bacterium]|nr:DNA helicase RecQ [bacterium]
MINYDNDLLYRVLRQYWGYDEFLTWQKEAVECVLTCRDSVTVLPTGGGKSLCFQLPAMCIPGMALVVSPLISLMKDQVDSLKDAGIPAAFINSSMSSAEHYSCLSDIRQNKIKILYIAPERLVMNSFIELLKAIKLSFIAIDEAHCISMWGHDFRPEYRQLKGLKNVFPNINIHSYTATATELVCQDICKELQLTAPMILTGSFDRPNLVYRVKHRDNVFNQICSVIANHKTESGIIYCIRRTDVDNLCSRLNQKGYNALAYHAGISDQDRKKNQEAFINDRVDIIVATVAFGMGINKSNVRYVIHAGMPKSLEHYQQETGRAGRDGLESECCLFFTYSDLMTWQKIIGDLDSEAGKIASKKLKEMYDFCISTSCRHQAIVSYFSQKLDTQSCGACDICLEEPELMEDALVIAQKIISCIVRLKNSGREAMGASSFGSAYIGRVLTGSKDQRILQAGHDRLSTWGILASEGKQNIRIWIEQLVLQEYLKRDDEYKTISVSEKGWGVIKNNETPRLTKSLQIHPEQPKPQLTAWEGVDNGLFNALRILRKNLAEKQNVPAYIVFSDASLKDMALRRPSNLNEFLHVTGVGQKKWETYGDTFVKTIVDYCTANSIGMDTMPAPVVIRQVKDSPLSAVKLHAFELFSQGCTIDEVATKVCRATSTVFGYLEEYIQQEKLTHPAPWVDDKTFMLVLKAMDEVGADRLKPIFDSLNGEIPYDLIRISRACAI